MTNDFIKTKQCGSRIELIMHPNVEGKPVTLDEGSLDEFEGVLVSLQDSLSENKAEASPRLLVLRSADPKYFCVGANVKALAELNEETMERWVRRGHRVLNILEDLPIPTIALIEGYAMGGGMELAMACDFIYAHENAKFSQSEAKLGFVPGWGATKRLPLRVGRQVAKRLFCTGELFPAERAAEIGFIDTVGSDEDLVREIELFERLLVENSAIAVAAFKKALGDDYSVSRDMNCEVEVSLSVKCIGDEDTKARVEAFLNRKKTKK